MLLRLFPAGSRPYLVYTLGILLLGVTVACGGGAASTSTPTGEIPGPTASPPEEPTIKPTSTQHSLPSPTPSSIPQETLTPSAPPTQFTPATTPTSASSEVETPQPATPTDTPLPTLTSVPTPTAVPTPIPTPSITPTTGVVDARPPNAPAPLSPANGTSTTDWRLTFEWSEVQDVGSARPVTYELQVDNNVNFGSPEVDAPGLTGTTFTSTTELAPGIYAWRVRARDGAGNVSRLPQVWAFIPVFPIWLKQVMR